MTLSVRAALTTLAAAAALTGCGGGSPLDNSTTIENPQGSGGRKLSFQYFQKCINPVFGETIAGSGGTNTCRSSGCHDTITGTGGALRIIPSATVVDLSNPANTADAVRLTDMYKNFYSSQGVTVIGEPTQSRLFAKPLLLNVLHGGGLIFTGGQQQAEAKLISYWISHPMPQNQDEFSAAGDALFGPAGECNS